MGSVCCIAARDKTSPHARNTGSSVCHGYSHRNAIYSPSWSFRWDGRSHVENSLESSVHLHRDFSLSNSRHTGGESKGGFAGDILSNGGSPMESFQTPTWPKSPVFSDAVEEFVPGGLGKNTEWLVVTLHLFSFHGIISWQFDAVVQL